MMNVEVKKDDSGSPGLFATPETQWQTACAIFLDAVPPKQRAAVRQILQNANCGGSGMRDWVSSIAFRGATLPACIPEEVIDVYLDDSEAVPLHDCGRCGFAVPIRPNRLHGVESEPEQTYFPTCPNCGGNTGPYFFWSRESAGTSAVSLPRKKPR
jgi:hypothetical protein